MTRRRSPRPEAARSWVKDIPNWLTGLAALATVTVTAVFGYIEISRDSANAPSPSPSATAATSEAIPSAGSSPSGAVVSVPNAPPAVIGGEDEDAPPPEVSLTSFGWENDVLRADGTVSGRSDNLWVAVQPTSRDPSEDWMAVRMHLLDDTSDPTVLADWNAIFADAESDARYRIKVFAEAGRPLGAGAGPDTSYRDYLEHGGASEPSEILDEVVEVTP